MSTRNTLLAGSRLRSAACRPAGTSLMEPRRKGPPLHLQPAAVMLFTKLNSFSPAGTGSWRRPPPLHRPPSVKQVGSDLLGGDLSSIPANETEVKGPKIHPHLPSLSNINETEILCLHLKLFFSFLFFFLEKIVSLL